MWCLLGPPTSGVVLLVSCSKKPLVAIKTTPEVGGAGASFLVDSTVLLLLLVVFFRVLALMALMVIIYVGLGYKDLLTLLSKA